ncbi:alpha/beta fold hydrolase [uncultured Acinetobacter sp.]|uniref:alpha/beta hydrolase family protein n=1 Tax=uncultured Acinetobacter sp. TaxID=165433 RepID=UPI0026347512|nr:alpha/beta fold hydrolase [uncultured Acinetobacter sp.]
MTQGKIQTRTVQFLAEDGYTLSGKLYQTEMPALANIVVACATGVPQAFYRRFAEYATAAGFQVLTFDYRGIAASAPKTLKNFKMSYLDWGRYDLTAAIEYLSKTGLDIYMIGHSYGGQALGLSKYHDRVEALYCFGTGAGWHGYMPFKEKIKVQVIWNIIFPPMVAVSGYLPWSLLKMGADLPYDVYREWRKWCKNPTYFFADPDLKVLHDQYAKVQTRIYAIAALDDAWALPASRQAFIQHYAQAKKSYIDIRAADYGLREIGHMGYFRQGAEKIWDEALNTFKHLHQQKYAA